MEPRPVLSSTGHGPRADAGRHSDAGMGTRVLVAGLVAGLVAPGLALIVVGPGSAAGGSATAASDLLVVASYGSVAIILAASVDHGIRSAGSSSGSSRSAS